MQANATVLHCNFVKNLSFLVYIASETEQLKNKMHSLATSYDLVKNIFLKAIFNTKSNDLICDLFIGRASSP